MNSSVTQGTSLPIRPHVPPSTTMRLGEHFSSFAIPIDHDVTISGWQTGSGPALLLLHGFPQTHLIWHKVAERLSATYTVVALDLRGYGASSKPADTDGSHARYAKSAMARDCATVMARLDHPQFFVVGHDRGGRVAHKLAVDYPTRVRRLMVLDIAPTLAMYDATDRVFATWYWHWFFLIQPAPFPERLMLAAPDVMIAKFLRMPKGDFHPDAYEEYAAQLRDAATVHGMCEDYRAASTCDLEESKEDLEKGRKIKCPVKAIWGAKGLIQIKFNAVDEWKKVCDNADVTGQAFDCGHYIPEEKPDELFAAIEDFMK